MKCPHCGNEIKDEQDYFLGNLQHIAGLRVMVSPYWKKGYILISADDWNNTAEGVIQKEMELMKELVEKYQLKGSP